MAHLLRGLAAGGTLRVIAADTTDLVAEALGRHTTGMTAGAALGRTLTASLLLDHFGLLAFEPAPMNLWKLAGAAMVVGGMMMIQFNR